MLGLDIGERRIGVAVSTPEGTLAVPLRIVERTDEASDLATIAEIARSEGAEAIVAGEPRSLSGTLGAQAARVEAFARRAAEACGLPLALQDERLTSVQAERAAPGGRRKRGPSDDVAAAIILQAYLDRTRNAPA